MDLKLVKIIKINFGNKDTTELLDIWNSNDRKSYSDEAFEAIRLILTERGVTVPQQPVHVPIEEKVNRQSKDSEELDEASKTNCKPQTEAGQHIEKAYSYKERNKFEDVLREADAAIKLNPSLAEAHNLRGIALEELGRKPQAIESYRQAIDLDPNFHQAKNNLSDLEARPHLEQAYSLKEAGELEEVLHECDAAIEIDPSMAEAHNLRGVALEELGRPKEALEAYRRALDIAPSFREAAFNLSELKAELKGTQQIGIIATHTDQAEADVVKHKMGRRKLLTILVSFVIVIAMIAAVVVPLVPSSRSYTPSEAEEYASLALDAAYNGNYHEALYYINHSIRLEPEFAYFYVLRGIYYDLVGEANLAIADINQAIQLEPEEASFYGLRGLVYYKLGDMEQALADLNQSIELDSSNAIAYKGRGMVYYNLSEMNLALADFNWSIALDSSDAHAYYYRGKVYYNLSDMDKALIDLDRFIGLNPDWAYVYHYRGMVYQSLGEEEQAIADFQMCLTLNPDEDIRQEVESYLEELGVKL